MMKMSRRESAAIFAMIDLRVEKERKSKRRGR
jgi:hypothetical protein